jgi:hypothetical protein
MILFKCSYLKRPFRIRLPSNNSYNIIFEKRNDEEFPLPCPSEPVG